MKKIKKLILLLVIVALFAGCQPTPDREVVVNQNKDIIKEVQSRSETTASASPEYLAKLELPEHYSYSTKNEAASLTINVDAGVYKTEVSKMPFARVKPMNFTQEQVTGMFNYLFPDEKPSLPRTQMTKKEIEEQILNFKKMISTGIDGDPISEEDKKDFEERINKLNEEYKTAPEKAPDPVISDGTLQYVEHTGNSIMHKEDGTFEEKQVTSKYYELNVTLNGTFLHIRASADDTNPESSLWYVNTDANFSTDKMVRVTKDEDLPEAAKEKLTLSLSDAIAKADDFFKAAGMDDVKLFTSFVVDNHGTGHVDDNWDPASKYAYKLYYTHTVNGVPVSCHESDSASGGEYSEPWFYESIEFLVSQDGILEIQWNEPCAVSEIVEDDSKLIDFDSAEAAFEKAVGYTYGQYVDTGDDVTMTVDVVIDSIQLNLVRMREKDKVTEKAGLYVPAYVFYGYVKEKSIYKNDNYTYEGYKTSSGSGNDFYPGPFMVIAVNAVDGSVINTMTDVT